jgi:hypothetical protein
MGGSSGPTDQVRRKQKVSFVGSDVLVTLIMKSAIFRTATPCSSTNFRRFGITYHLHLQGEREKQTRLSLPPASAGSKTTGRFEGTYRLNLQGRRISQVCKVQLPNCFCRLGESPTFRRNIFLSSRLKSKPSKAQLATCFCWFQDSPTFRSNIPPQSSGSNIKPKKKPADLGSACHLLISCLLIQQ